MTWQILWPIIASVALSLAGNVIFVRWLFKWKKEQNVPDALFSKYEELKDKVSEMHTDLMVANEKIDGDREQIKRLWSRVNGTQWKAGGQAT